MQLKGKTIAVLGDSITEGAGASSVENGFVSVLGRLSGATTLNYGIGGTRMAKQRAASEAKFDLDFGSRIAGMSEHADVVLVFGGTNDFGHGDAEFGRFSDRENDTFYGACHYVFSSLIKKYPDAFIAVLTPLHRLTEETTLNEFGIRRQPLIDYVRAEREVAEYYGLPVIDLYSESGLQPNVEIIRERYMPDGLHPNDAGAKKLAETIYAFLLAH